jgi:hypothetical protein
MSFPRQRAPGLWTFDSDVLPAEFEAFDANLSNAIDGLNGGAYALQHDLVIGSAVAMVQFDAQTFFSRDVNIDTSLFEVHGSMWFDGPVLVSGATLALDVNVVTLGTSSSDAFTVRSFTQFDATTIFNADAFFEAGATFVDDVTFGANVTINGTTLDVNSGITTIGSSGADAFTVHGFTQFYDIANFYSDVFFSGNVILGDSNADAVVIKGASSLQAPMTMSATGAIAHRAVAGNDTTTTYSPLTVHEVVMEDGVLTGSSDWIIDDTNCTDGQEILFCNKDTTGHAMDVRRPGGSLIKQLLKAWGRFVRIGGVWQMTSYGSYP